MALCVNHESTIAYDATLNTSDVGVAAFSRHSE